MALRPYITLCFVATLLAGCMGGGGEPPKIYHTLISKEIQPNSVYYSQATTGSDATIGVIYYVDSERKAAPLIGNVDRAFWKDFVLALTGVAGQVGAAAVHGISFEAAKTIIKNTVDTNNANTNTNTNTNTNNACTGNNSC